MARILSIVPYKFLPPVNGGHWGIIIVEKTLSVLNKVHTVTVDANEIKKDYPFEVYPILANKKQRYLPFNQYTKVAALAKKLKPDYIFCHHHYMFPMAKKLAKRLQIPVYIRCHNIESERFRTTGRWWWKAMFYFEKYAFKNADGVFFVTEEDKEWSMKKYGTDKDKSVVMPFGIDFECTPSLPVVNRDMLAKQYNLNVDVPWLFFMGQLDYEPNAQAVRLITEHIYPILKARGLSCHILVCGKNLSTLQQEEIESLGTDEVRHLGFVPEIEPVIAACDIMINPVISGGGVKTKVIESLAWNKTVVSSHSGAIGIENKMCGDKLQIAADHDWQGFVDLIQGVLSTEKANIPSQFYDYYYAKNIASRMQQYFGGQKGY